MVRHDVITPPANGNHIKKVSFRINLLVAFVFLSLEDTFTSKGDIQKEKKTYTKNTAKLKDNHILMVMVNANKGELVSHPLILGKLRYETKPYALVLCVFARCNYSIHVVTLFMHTCAGGVIVLRID